VTRSATAQAALPRLPHLQESRLCVESTIISARSSFYENTDFTGRSFRHLAPAVWKSFPGTVAYLEVHSTQLYCDILAAEQLNSWIAKYSSIA